MVIKKETEAKKYRLYLNRFSAYVLQVKPKNKARANWRIVNAFSKKRNATVFLESLTKPAPEVAVFKLEKI